MFNVYIVNFGADYFNKTIDNDIQGVVKKRIKSNSKKIKEQK